MRMNEAAQWLGSAQQAMQDMRFDDACAAFAQALDVAPGSIDALRGLGYSRLQLGQLAGALDALERALRIDGADPLSLLLMGRLCLRLQQPVAARAHFAQILARVPGSEAARSGLIDALVAQGDLHAARIEAETLWRDRPGSEVAGLAAARMAYYACDDERAVALFSRLAQAFPGNAGHRYNRALSLLRQGRYEQAWPDYEARFAAGAVHAPLPRTPRWDGGAAGHLLVVAEQGLGDAVLFARFIGQAAARTARLTFICPAPLRSLLARSLGVDCVAPPSVRDGWPEHDVHAPLMSLPHLLGAGAQAVAPRPAYLAADPSRVQAWRAALGPSPGLRVGLASAASIAHSTESNFFMRRTCPAAELRPLLRVAGITAFNLNTGPAADEARCELPGLRDLPLPLADFDDTAAAVRCMDLVVSVDTAAAHVAGATGVPLRLLLPYSRDWRWSQAGGALPWYREVQAHAQAFPGDWAGSVRQLADALAQAAGARLSTGIGET